MLNKKTLVYARINLVVHVPRSVAPEYEAEYTAIMAQLEPAIRNAFSRTPGVQVEIDG